MDTSKKLIVFVLGILICLIVLFVILVKSPKRAPEVKEQNKSSELTIEEIRASLTAPGESTLTPEERDAALKSLTAPKE